ncbi:MAG: stage III sporulation protein AF [Clostridia bacterium]|nr:stage III sporulation protein AF [Clostridia bacterium]
MINFLSSWVKNLSLALIIVSVLEMILPNNKTKKYIKMIMGLYILFSIISPFIENSDEFDINNVNLNFYSEEIEETSSTSESVDQSSMDNRLNQIYKEELEKDIIKKIEEQGYEIESCKVTAHISENDSGIEKISLKIKGKINEDNNEQEDTNTLENKIVKEIQKIQKVEVSVSENNQDDKNYNSQETTNLTKTDIKIIKDFLKKEYGVNEECLKIS